MSYSEVLRAVIEFLRSVPESPWLRTPNLADPEATRETESVPKSRLLRLHGSPLTAVAVVVLLAAPVVVIHYELASSASIFSSAGPPLTVNLSASASPRDASSGASGGSDSVGSLKGLVVVTPTATATPIPTPKSTPTAMPTLRPTPTSMLIFKPRPVRPLEFAAPAWRRPGVRTPVTGAELAMVVSRIRIVLGPVLVFAGLWVWRRQRYFSQGCVSRWWQRSPRRRDVWAGAPAGLE